MNDEYRCTCGHAVYSHSTRDDTSHCLAIDCECYAYQADSYAAGAAAELARVVAVIEAERDLWATVDTPNGGIREEMCAALIEKVSP